MAARRPAAPARPPSRSATTPAREVALAVLRAVTDRDAYANLLLPALLTERGLHGRDAALATELAYGTLRGRGSYDAVLATCSTRALADIDPPLLDVLRLGTHQLLATRIGPHAAVATSVALARDVAGAGAAGFANAVLRRVATRDLDSWIAAVAPDRAADPVGYLAVKTSHPGWIVAAVSESLGEEPVTGLPLTEEALAANGIRPRVTLCAVPGLAAPADLVARGSQAAPGRRSAHIWTAATPQGYLRSGRAVWPCRTRRASLPRSRWPAWTQAPRTRARGALVATAAGSICAPGPAERRGCSPAWRRAAAPGCSPPTSGNTGPGWCARRWPRSAPPRGGRGGRHQARLAARLVRPGDRRCPLLRDSGPCGAARTRAGARRRPTWRRSASCSVRCSAPRSTLPGPAG